MYDAAFMGVLQSCGKLQTFLDEMFSFLARRTDFYVIMTHEKAKMGFPPGVSQEMVMQVGNYESACEVTHVTCSPADL